MKVGDMVKFKHSGSEEIAYFPEIGNNSNVVPTHLRKLRYLHSVFKDINSYHNINIGALLFPGKGIVVEIGKETAKVYWNNMENTIWHPKICLEVINESR